MKTKIKIELTIEEVKMIESALRHSSNKMLKMHGEFKSENNCFFNLFKKYDDLRQIIIDNIKP